jgi:putative addiction module component (TIGR02574 family)
MIKAEEIHQMPLHEKLQVMETLWDDIARHGDDLEMPQWQKDLLDERERLITEGKAEFVDWDKAKEQIAKAAQ